MQTLFAAYVWVPLNARAVVTSCCPDESHGTRITVENSMKQTEESRTTPGEFLFSPLLCAFRCLVIDCQLTGEQ